MLCRAHSWAMSVLLKNGRSYVIPEDSSIEGFGGSPECLSSTDKVIEVIDHLLPHFLF
jgi:hypothetical protein